MADMIELQYPKYVGSSENHIVNGKRKLIIKAQVGSGWKSIFVATMASPKMAFARGSRGAPTIGMAMMLRPMNQSRFCFQVSREKRRISQKRLPSNLNKRMSRYKETTLARVTMNVQYFADSSQADFVPEA